MHISHTGSVHQSSPLCDRCALQISVHGKELPRATQPFYFAVNKPKGYLCANAPNKEGTTKLVVDLFEVGASFASHPSRLHPTGPCSRLNITATIHGSVTRQHWLAFPVLSPVKWRAAS